MERFFGGNPGVVLIRLAVISLIVGILLSALGLSPYDIINSIKTLAQRIYNMGFDAIEWVFRYFLLGAVIVFPVWLVSRLMKVAGKGTATGSAQTPTSRTD
ncbi:MAG: DUF6460 domain-containing protein [Hyphomicrobiaceae bacterium]|nr:DUF6460 domain-containing protein [Hyphomicrobiaceae bacterium]